MHRKKGLCPCNLVLQTAGETEPQSIDWARGFLILLTANLAQYFNIAKVFVSFNILESHE
jgi:hypothetical protein